MVTARGDSATNLPMRWLSSAGGRSLVSTHAWNWNHYTSILLFMFVNRMRRAHFQAVCSQGFSRLRCVSFACFIIMDVMGSCVVKLSSRWRWCSAQHNAQNEIWEWRSAHLFCQVSTNSFLLSSRSVNKVAQPSENTSTSGHQTKYYSVCAALHNIFVWLVWGKCAEFSIL